MIGSSKSLRSTFSVRLFSFSEISARLPYGTKPKKKEDAVILSRNDTRALRVSCNGTLWKERKVDEKTVYMFFHSSKKGKQTHNEERDK